VPVLSFGAVRTRCRSIRHWIKQLVAVGLVVVCLLSAGQLVAEPRTDIYTGVGILGLTVTNLGYVGNSFNGCYQPSGEYPLHSNVEHVYSGGIWVGAVNAQGDTLVSTGSQDASSLQDGDDIREFQDVMGEPVYIWSNNQNDIEHYDVRALSTQHIQVLMDDYKISESGNHVPLGLQVELRALAWSAPYADDFVILDYAVTNISGTELRDVYLGFWNDFTVGNVENTVPSSCDPNAPVPWTFWDDVNSAWGPAEWVDEEYAVPDDPDIWLMHEHDEDGDEGLATSWVGTRLLGTIPPVEPRVDMPPVSYNSWQFRHVPEEDAGYVGEDGEWQPGKYNLMANGKFTVGVTEDADYTIPSNWVGLLSTGPWSTLAADSTLHITVAITCGPDSLGLLANSQVAQVAYDEGFTIPGGPPSPIIQPDYEWNSIKLQWAPGDSLDEAGNVLDPEDSRRSPEHHISTITGKPDFQGYRVYRYAGLDITGDPYEISDMIAQFDKIDGIGFDTGLPPINEDGFREFVDTDLLDGFPYWYSVVSFSAPDLEEGLPEFQSGFNENSVLLYPGPQGPLDAEGGAISVVPNPYRGGSYFDTQGADPELGRKIWFVNLPPRCSVKIFTLSGDLVRTLEHDDPNDGKEPWDVLSDYGRAIATGLYIYVVENKDSGEVQRGKLVIIK